MPGLNWIKNNVTPDELILDFWWTSDEPSHVGHFQSPYKWLGGISYQHYLNDEISYFDVLTTEQVDDINYSFKNYGYDFPLWFTLHHYDISFILTRPDNIRDDILEQYHFLELVYADDFTRIYQISYKTSPEGHFFSLLEEAKNKQDMGDFKGTLEIYEEKILPLEKFFPDGPDNRTLLIDLFGHVIESDDNESGLIILEILTKRFSVFSDVTLFGELKPVTIIRYVIESDDNANGLRVLEIFTEHYKFSDDKISFDELKPVALELAKYFEDEHQIGNAILVYNTLLEFERFDYESLINKGRLHEIRGEYSLALHAYEQAYPLNPNDEIQFKMSNLLAKIRTK